MSKYFSIIMLTLLLFIGCSSSDDNNITTPNSSSSSISSSDSNISSDSLQDSTLQKDSTTTSDSTASSSSQSSINDSLAIDPPNYPNLIPVDSNISAFEINKLIGKGINLGNALEAKGGEGAWGVTLEEYYFSAIADSGFTAVRVPIRWNDLTEDTPPYSIDSSLVKRVDWVIDNALKNGLMVIINQHHFDPLYTDVEGQKDKFLAIWEQISRRYQKYPQNLIFEILNEPRDELSGKTWSDLQLEALKIIRKTNPTRKVILSGDNWGGASGLKNIEIPKDDKNIIITFHYYEPFQFTHQGASWVNGADAWLGTTWEGTYLEKLAVYETFKEVKDLADANNVPVFVGEFGAYSKADTLSRFRWTQFVQNVAQYFEFSTAYWEFCSGFGVYDANTDTWRKFLMDALLRNDGIVDVTTSENRPLDSVYLLLDDFEDKYGDIPLNNALMAYRASVLGLPTDTVGGWWYVFSNPQSTCLAPTGDTLLKLGDEVIVTQDNDTIYTQIKYDEKRDKMIGNYGKDGSKGLNVIFNIKGNNYPFIGVGTNLSTEDKKWIDFSNLSAVSFWAKGHGELRVKFETDTVGQLGDWGHFGKDFTLTDEWKEYKVFADELAPMKYSKTEQYKISWEDACKKVSEFQIINNQYYGKVCDDSINIAIDDIKLHGMTPADFGF